MAPRRRVCKRGVAPKVPGKKLPAVAAKARDSSGSSTGSSSRSNDGSSSSSDTCSDEDDPRDYKRGGYHPVTPYQLYNGRYRVLSKLGAGAFSTVWLCADEKPVTADLPDGGPQLVAMKVCKSKKSVTEQALDEILLFDKMNDKNGNSPHVVQMRGHFWHQGPNGRHKCMVFEVMGENLLALVKYRDYNGLPLNMVRRLAHHTLAGLEYIHAHGVIHTDVKLENVLVQRHDLVELVVESRRAHHAFMEQRKGMESLSKSQKKRMKKKQKAQVGETQDKNDDGENAGADEQAKPVDAEQSCEKTEAAEGMTEEDQAAAQACGRPVPPVRQRDRFDTLSSDIVFAKLADFGNGIQKDKKVTDDIQTRQYRSPEVIIGADWDETADVWSAACMFFELITGDFLFDPRTGKDWTRDEDHLALMIELLGSHPPKEWALSGKYSREFFATTGKLKHIKSLKFWSLSDVLKDKYSLSEPESKEIADFLLPMLMWEPRCRQSASNALKHPWIQKWDEVEEKARRKVTESSEEGESETSVEGEADEEKEKEVDVSDIVKTTACEVEHVEKEKAPEVSAAVATQDAEEDAQVDKLTKAAAIQATKEVNKFANEVVAKAAAAAAAAEAATAAAAAARGKGKGNVGSRNSNVTAVPIDATNTTPAPVCERDGDQVEDAEEDAEVDEAEGDLGAGGEAKKKKKKNKKQGKK